MELSFKRNIGNVDRTLRVILGITLLYLSAFEPFPIDNIWVIVLGAIGIVMAIEGAVGY